MVRAMQQAFYTNPRDRFQDQHYRRVMVVSLCSGPQWLPVHAMVWLYVKDCVRGSYRMVTQPLIEAMRQAFYINPWDNFLDQHYKHCMVVLLAVSLNECPFIQLCDCMWRVPCEGHIGWSPNHSSLMSCDKLCTPIPAINSKTSILSASWWCLFAMILNDWMFI